MKLIFAILLLALLPITASAQSTGMPSPYIGNDQDDSSTVAPQDQNCWQTALLDEGGAQTDYIEVRYGAQGAEATFISDMKHAAAQWSTCETNAATPFDNHLAAFHAFRVLYFLERDTDHSATNVCASMRTIAGAADIRSIVQTFLTQYCNGTPEKPGGQVQSTDPATNGAPRIVREAKI